MTQKSYSHWLLINTSLHLIGKKQREIIKCRKAEKKERRILRKIEKERLEKERMEKERLRK